MQVSGSNICYLANLDTIILRFSVIVNSMYYFILQDYLSLRVTDI